MTLRKIIIAYKFFSCNSEITPVSQAVVPLNNVEYAYGFGVYENIRVRNGQAQFADQHCQRLINSAKIIGIEHGFDSRSIQKSIADLLQANQANSCNVKILLIGAPDPANTKLHILCLNPLYPDRKLYKQGAKVITQQFERPYPHAKSLNMLPSYLAYREAKKAKAYDALAINLKGEITEGTRTNFFAINDRQIISPPAGDILLGVTRDHVIKTAHDIGFEVVNEPIRLTDLDSYQGFFLTSTSSKIMPISQIDQTSIQVPDSLRELILGFDKFLAELFKD